MVVSGRLAVCSSLFISSARPSGTLWIGGWRTEQPIERAEDGQKKNLFPLRGIELIFLGRAVTRMVGVASGPFLMDC